MSDIFAQVKLDGTSAVDFGGVRIPQSQAQPPAANEWLAFRPGCSQLNANVIQIGDSPGFVEYSVVMPDGAKKVLAVLEDVLPEPQAHMELGAMGICKTGTAADGTVNVPLVYADDIPQSLIAAPTADATGQDPLPTPVDGGPPWLTLSLGALGIAVIVLGCVIVAARSRSGDELPQDDARPPSDNPFHDI